MLFILFGVRDSRVQLFSDQLLFQTSITDISTQYNLKIIHNCNYYAYLFCLNIINFQLHLSDNKLFLQIFKYELPQNMFGKRYLLIFKQFKILLLIIIMYRYISSVSGYLRNISLLNAFFANH